MANSSNSLVKSPGLPDLTWEIFAEKLSFALTLVGVQIIFNLEDEVGTATAAADVGVPYILICAFETSIEKVAHSKWMVRDGNIYIGLLMSTMILQ